ncbi:MAG: DUF721 domain-containing protein [Phycisphaerae bacterium]
MPPRKKNNGQKPAARSNAPSPENISNLEMRGDRLKVFSLQTLLTNKKSKETRETAKLGEVLLPWFEKMVEKPAEKMEGVLELWMELAPPNLKERARLVSFQRGTLTIAVESATVRAELDGQLRQGLLRKLQMGSKGAIFRIKTSVQPLREM